MFLLTYLLTKNLSTKCFAVNTTAQKHFTTCPGGGASAPLAHELNTHSIQSQYRAQTVLMLC